MRTPPSSTSARHRVAELVAVGLAVTSRIWTSCSPLSIGQHGVSRLEPNRADRSISSANDSGTPRTCDCAEIVRRHRCTGCRERHRTAACAFSSIASNTGARSPGEELMTCNTSAVAVCCSSASRVSVMQPRVLHRDDRLRREVLQQRDLLVGERPTSGR